MSRINLPDASNRGINIDGPHWHTEQHTGVPGITRLQRVPPERPASIELWSHTWHR